MGKPGPEALVFCDHEDKPLRGDRVTMMWKRVRPRAVRFHNLRHTHASALISAGVDVVTISKRLGHSSPSLTLSTYSHMFANTDAKAAAAIGKVLQAAANME
jgi:integrase